VTCLPRSRLTGLPGDARPPPHDRGAAGQAGGAAHRRTPLGSIRLGAVKPSEVQGWASDRARVLAHATVVKLPRQERPRLEPLTVDQVRSLADAMPPRAKTLVLTQAGLGLRLRLRLGELLGMRVRDVDFLRRTVTVTGSSAGTGTRCWRPKSPRSRRTVPLLAVVGDALAADLAAYPRRSSRFAVRQLDRRPVGPRPLQRPDLGCRTQAGRTTGGDIDARSAASLHVGAAGRR